MRGAYQHNVFFLASALTFDAIIAAVPLVLLVLAILGYVVNARLGGVREVHILFDRLLPSHGTGPNDPLAQAERLVTRVVAGRARLSAFGIPLFIWFGARFFGSVRAALHQIFGGPASRPWLAGKSVDLLLVLVTLVWLIANTALTAPAVDAGWSGRMAANTIAFVLGVGWFYVIYAFAPSRHAPRHAALIAAIFTALAFRVAQRFYAIYVARFTTIDQLISDANAIALALFILWIYYSAFVFLLGAEVAVAYEGMTRGPEGKS
jgi:membrane protein